VRFALGGVRAYNDFMPDSIHTHSVGRGFAVSDEIVLDESPRTRIVFRPELHGGGVRGHIIRQKISADGNWADSNEINFNRVPADCGVRIELNTDATQKLFEKLTHIYQVQSQGVAYGDHKFVVAEEDEVVVVNDRNKAAVIQTLVDQGLSEEFWDTLSAADPDLAARLAAGRIQYEREQALSEFETALRAHTDDEAYWQRFFELNLWLLQGIFASTVYFVGGDVYVGGKGPIGRQGRGGVATDFLFSDDSTKSFAVVEIKTPTASIVGARYRGRTGENDRNETFSMHGELTGGIVQTRNQIAVAIEDFESVLGRALGPDLNRIHPKGVLIIGKVDGLSQRQLESFNHFRYGLSDLTVVTFDELLKRSQLLFAANSGAAQPSSSMNDRESVSSDDIPF
jgi:hypothetical protein